MKVAFLVNDLGTGGAQSLIVNIVEGSDWDGDRPVVCFLGGDDEHVATLEAAGIEVVDFGAVTMPPQYDPRAIARMWRYFRSHEFDVIHAHLPYAVSLARLVARRTGTPVVSTQHCIPKLLNPVERVLDWATRPLDAAMVSVSRSVAASLDADGRVPARSPVIYNGIDADGFGHLVENADPVDLGREYGIPEDAVVFLTIGRCVEIKRQVDIVHAMKDLLTEMPAAHLVVVGDGDAFDALEREVADLGLESVVTLVGAVPKSEVHRFYARADAFVIASLFEGMPMTILEAMAASLPVVATAVPGVAEFVDDGVTGYLVEPKSPGQLARAMSSLADADERERLGTNGRRAGEAFDISATTAAYRALYEQVAGVPVEERLAPKHVSVTVPRN